MREEPEHHVDQSTSLNNEDSKDANLKIIQKYYDMPFQRKENTFRKKHIRRCARELKKEFPCL